MNKIAVGSFGQSLAAEFLQKKAGLKIVSQNWRCPVGEIDLVAQSPEGELVIAEVKTRTGIKDHLWESVDFKKQSRLVRLARWYLKTKGYSLDTPVRFDIVVVLKSTNEIHHLPHAFQADREI